MIKVRKFIAFDVEMFKPLEIFHDGAKQRTIWASQCGAHVYTLFDDTGVMGIVGCSPLWPGRADMWSHLGDGIHRDPKEFSLEVGKLIEKQFVDLNLHRAEAHVKVGYEQGVKWVERFGFVREGIMKQYLPDKADAYLYARYA